MGDLFSLAYLPSILSTRKCTSFLHLLFPGQEKNLTDYRAVYTNCETHSGEENRYTGEWAAAKYGKIRARCSVNSFTPTVSSLPHQVIILLPSRRVLQVTTTTRAPLLRAAAWAL